MDVEQGRVWCGAADCWCPDVRELSAGLTEASRAAGTGYPPTPPGQAAAGSCPLATGSWGAIGKEERAFSFQHHPLECRLDGARSLLPCTSGVTFRLAEAANFFSVPRKFPRAEGTHFGCLLQPPCEGRGVKPFPRPAQGRCQGSNIQRGCRGGEKNPTLPAAPRPPN